MLPIARSCAKLPDLVGQLCVSVPGEPLQAVEMIGPDDVPEPYRGLLVHDSDMTSTLARYHGESIRLHELQRVVTPQWLGRRSVLETTRTGRPVEYGLIRIHLASLAEPVCQQVLEGRKPLGGLLNAHGVAYRSCPGGFLRVEPNATMREVFGLDGGVWLYGRCNCLSEPGGRPIAEVIEILPP